jgi:MFS family permease
VASHPASPSDPPSSSRTANEDAELRNTACLAAQQASIRVGWIFKLESVVIPAFLDTLDGSGWLRGLLPVLNRIGQSGASFLLADSVRRMARKKWLLMLSSLGMALPFAAIGLGMSMLEPGRAGWRTAAFLALYFVFFIAVGLSVLAYGTLQGKLIPAGRRGRLLALGTFGGAVPAILAAGWVLPAWLAEAEAGWSKIFGLAGAFFLLSALAAVGIRESPDTTVTAKEDVRHAFSDALGVLRTDVQFRRLVVVSVLFTASIMLIPHYQALGRDRLGLGGSDLMFWVIAQTASVGAGSVLIGPIADRYGNKHALRAMIGLLLLAPLCALALVHAPPEIGVKAYVGVFALLGVTPLAMRLSMNYLLELAPEAEHPRYISIVQALTAIFMLASPLLGLLIDVVGYEAVFLGVTLLIGLSEWLAGGLVDPRVAARGPGERYSR